RGMAARLHRKASVVLTSPVRAGCVAVACALLLATAAHAQSAATADGLAPANSQARDALARQRDAESLFSVSAEGKALYERDVVKLDGYGYCGRSIALAEQGEFRQSIRAASKALHLGTRPARRVRSS